MRSGADMAQGSIEAGSGDGARLLWVRPQGDEGRTGMGMDSGKGKVVS